ncbi:putative reverse transcriptase domain-containing protein, partial [Tanacetum coccineum]
SKYHWYLHKHVQTPALSSWEIETGLIGKMQLRNVELGSVFNHQPGSLFCLIFCICARLFTCARFYFDDCWEFAATRVGFVCFGYGKRFLSKKGSEVGRGVKEKKQCDGGDHSLGNGGALSRMGVAHLSNTVDDVGKDSYGLNSSHTKVTPGNSIVNKEGNLHDQNDGLTPGKSTANPNKGTSYANLFTCGPSRKAMNFGTLFTPTGNGVDVVVPVESIRAISEWFANTIYGFFFGKRVTYPVFSSMDCLDVMLENGLWFIQNNLLILKKWYPNVNILKEDVGNILWVKLHGVHVIAFSEVGLSVIATKIGTLLMLDSYTSEMCIQSWVRSSYARALIEVWADVELKDNIGVDMLKIFEEGSIRVMFVLSMNGNLSGVHVVSEDEVALVDNDMANFLTSKKVGYGTNSLLEQWKESYVNGDYDLDPYDVDIYEGQDIPDKI